MIIAVDFDGTIVEHRYPEIGREKPFAFDTLKMLQKEGHRLILWTVREDKLLEEAEALIVKAHNAQTEVIQSQVSGESMEYSLLFVHAQDTVMTITTELRMTQKLLPIVKMLLNKKGD